MFDSFVDIQKKAKQIAVKMIPEESDGCCTPISLHLVRLQVYNLQEEYPVLVLSLSKPKQYNIL
jgi:hypothetical protein